MGIHILLRSFLASAKKFSMIYKFIISLLICVVFLTVSSVHAAEKIKLVTSFTVIADMASEVAGGAADVVSITKPGAEIHDYQPTPQDIVRAQGADLILWNGMNLERWFERFLQDISDVPDAVITAGITPLSIYEGPYSGKPNPHAWMSFGNAQIYVRNIEAALSGVDPKNASIYKANADGYIAKLQDLKTELTSVLKDVPVEKRWLVSSEGAFSYLAEDLNIRELYIWPINADQQATPKQIKAVIDTIRANQIPVVFSESTISDKPARQIATETGILYGGVLYVDSLSAPDGPVPTYFDLMRVTVKTISDAFSKVSQAQ